MSRTNIEVTEELNLLNDLRHRVPSRTTFGDDNQEAIDAQITVIEEWMTFEEAIDRFEEDGSYILSAALDAVRWLHDDDEPVSESWVDMVVISPVSEIHAVVA